MNENGCPDCYHKDQVIISLHSELEQLKSQPFGSAQGKPTMTDEECASLVRGRREVKGEDGAIYEIIYITEMSDFEAAEAIAAHRRKAVEEWRGIAGDIVRFWDRSVGLVHHATAGPSDRCPTCDLKESIDAVRKLVSREVENDKR